MSFLTAALLAEQRLLVLWGPVGMALGVLAYFLLPQEPGAVWGVGLPLIVLVLGAVFLAVGWLSVWGRLAGGTCMALALGFVSAWSAAHRQPPMPELPRRAVVVSGIVQSMTVLSPRGADDSAGARRWCWPGPDSPLRWIRVCGLCTARLASPCARTILRALCPEMRCRCGLCCGLRRFRHFPAGAICSVRRGLQAVPGPGERLG